MRKELVKEVPFGKALARITVVSFTEKKYSDGILLGERVRTSAKVEIIVNGKVVEKGSFADILEFSNISESLYSKFGLDPSKKYSRVGNSAITLGAETANLINAAIKEMKKELAKEFNIETEEEKQQKEEFEEAKAIIAHAEEEGIENLMSEEEIKAWRKRYNGMYNEGGEGYIPIRVSQEQYQKAMNVMAGKDVE